METLKQQIKINTPTTDKQLLVENELRSVMYMFHPIVEIDRTPNYPCKYNLSTLINSVEALRSKVNQLTIK